jgi:hypothetical protein
VTLVFFFVFYVVENKKPQKTRDNAAARSALAAALSRILYGFCAVIITAGLF